MFADGKPNPYMAVTPVPANGRPPIAVIIPTRDRAEIVCNAIRSLKRNLSYAGELRWWLGIDGSDDTPVLVRAEFPDVGLVEAPRRGLGANLNALIQAAQRRIDQLARRNELAIVHATLRLPVEVRDQGGDERREAQGRDRERRPAPGARIRLDV